MFPNPFPNKPWFLCVCSTSLLKTLREKEKLLITSNFSFSHSVFYLFQELSAIFVKSQIVICKLIQFGRVFIKFVVWERVNPKPQNPLPNNPNEVTVENIVGKEEYVANQHFLLFPQCFVSVQGKVDSFGNTE